MGYYFALGAYLQKIFNLKNEFNILFYNSIVIFVQARRRVSQLLIRKSYKPVQQKMYFPKLTNRSDLLTLHANTPRLWTNDAERVDSI